MLRWALTITYVVVLVVALVVQLFYPSISAILFWGVLGWFVVSLFLYRLPAMNRPVFPMKRSRCVISPPRTFRGTTLPFAPPAKRCATGWR